MKRILITGINGFAASHLARKLVEEGDEVHGTIRTRSDKGKIKDILPKIQTYLCEMTDAHAVEQCILKVHPEEIYHLAAQSYVKLSWDAPLETYRVNVEGTINVFEAIRKHKIDCAVLVTSTSEVYGEKEGSINEKTMPEPITHYGISKYAQDLIARLYHRSYGIKVVVTRAFNITGAGRADVFVDSSFAKQIAEIEKGAKPVIKHGNLESERDFVNVEDVVNGYVKALRSEKWGEIFCLGTGEPIKIKDILDKLISLSTMWRIIEREVDPERFRPVDTKTMKCDWRKAKKVLGWKPTVNWIVSMKQLLDYWRANL